MSPNEELAALAKRLTVAAADGDADHTATPLKALEDSRIPSFLLTQIGRNS